MAERPLSVAIFSDSALPILNGVSVSIDSLIHSLRQEGHSVTLFTAAHFNFRDADPNTYRFPAVETPWTKGYPLAFPPFYPMLRKFRRHRFDLVHTHTPFTIGFVGLRWAESHGLPIVSTYHTLYDKYVHYIPFAPKRYLRYKLAKHTNFYYNSVDHVITPSEASRKWLLRHSVQRPITVIPTSPLAPAILDRSESRQRLGVPPNRRLLLYVGRIAREKNLSVLLEAFAIAIRREPTLLLWLVGDGPARDQLVEMTRDLGLGDSVRFCGFQPRADVDAYYAAADLFVFPSMTETQGLVVQEAMSHGLPAVVIQGGGASAALMDGENGYIVPNRPDVFADRWMDILGSDRLYARLSSSALASVRGATTEVMTSSVLEVYREVVEAKSRSISQLVSAPSMRA